MNNYNKSKNQELIVLVVKFEEYNGQYLYKWWTNCWVYSLKDIWWIVY